MSLLKRIIEHERAKPKEKPVAKSPTIIGTVWKIGTVWEFEAAIPIGIGSCVKCDNAGKLILSKASDQNCIGVTVQGARQPGARVGVYLW